MIGLGILGEYVGRIFVETKQRPPYLVREVVGVEPRSEDGPFVVQAERKAAAADRRGRQRSRAKQSGI